MKPTNASNARRLQMFRTGKLIQGVACDHCDKVAVAMTHEGSAGSVRVHCVEGLAEYRIDSRARWEAQRAGVMAALGLK